MHDCTLTSSIYNNLLNFKHNSIGVLSANMQCTNIYILLFHIDKQTLIQKVTIPFGAHLNSLVINNLRFYVTRLHPAEKSST